MCTDYDATIITINKPPSVSSFSFAHNNYYDCLQWAVVHYGAGARMGEDVLQKVNIIEVPHDERITIISATHDTKQSFSKY